MEFLERTEENLQKAKYYYYDTVLSFAVGATSIKMPQSEEEFNIFMKAIKDCTEEAYDFSKCSNHKMEIHGFDLKPYFQKILGVYENMIIMVFDWKGNELYGYKVFAGEKTSTGTRVNREILRFVDSIKRDHEVENLKVVMAHNHPNVVVASPSHGDTKFNMTLNQALKVQQAALEDAFVITQFDAFSQRQRDFELLLEGKDEESILYTTDIFTPKNDTPTYLYYAKRLRNPALYDYDYLQLLKAKKEEN